MSPIIYHKYGCKLNRVELGLQAQFSPYLLHHLCSFSPTIKVGASYFSIKKKKKKENRWLKNLQQGKKKKEKL